MASGKNRTTGQKRPTELYLKVPYHILNIPGLGLCEKVLLAHLQLRRKRLLAKQHYARPDVLRRRPYNLKMAGKTEKEHSGTVGASEGPVSNDMGQITSEGKDGRLTVIYGSANKQRSGDIRPRRCYSAKAELSRGYGQTCRSYCVKSVHSSRTELSTY